MTIEELARTCRRITEEVATTIVGKQAFLEKMLAAFLAEGHVLIEDFPGLAKTLAARSFAEVMGLVFKRIQFTPDLLPADVTGGYLMNRQTSSFQLMKGPVFAHIVLADEINRAPPKTQAALLEAMGERQVTLEGITHHLERPFFVIATQNPIEYEGTFPLPEAQLDRFMVRLSIGYPDESEELEILARRRGRRQDELRLSAVTGREEIERMRAAVESVHVDEDVARYMVRLVRATRSAAHAAVGASPRASLALMKLSRVRAAMAGRSFVVPDDVKEVAADVLAHRVMVKPDLWAAEASGKSVVEAVLQSVDVPKVRMP
jgi:MoxR-like ATPase